MAEIVENPLKQTIPFDPRFPNMNQTRNCWQNYVDFHRCQKLKVKSLKPQNPIFPHYKYLSGWGVWTMPVLLQELQDYLPQCVGREVSLIKSIPWMISKSLFQVGRPAGERSLPRQPLDNLRVICNSPEVVKITWIYGLFDINPTEELWLDQSFCCRLKCKPVKLWRVVITFQGYYIIANQRWI